ncbi:hypothetical protein pb186bvf_019084 [Paramecium bursaria]
MEEDSIRETFNSLDLTHSYWSLNIALDQLEHIKIVIYYINDIQSLMDSPDPLFISLLKKILESDIRINIEYNKGESCSCSWRNIIQVIKCLEKFDILNLPHHFDQICQRIPNLQDQEQYGKFNLISHINASNMESNWQSQQIQKLYLDMLLRKQVIYVKKKIKNQIY